MAVNVNNAYVGTPPIDGGVYFNAPQGTTLPTSATEALDPAFVDHGAVDENGITVTPNRTSTTEKMFGGGDFIDIQTEYGEEVQITFMEDDNDAVIASSFGDANVDVTDATTTDGKQRTIYHTKEQLPIKSHVIKTVSGSKAKTYVVPLGRVSTVEKTPDVHSASTKTTLTIKTFESQIDNRPVYVVEYRDDGTPVIEGGGEGGDEG